MDSSRKLFELIREGNLSRVSDGVLESSAEAVAPFLPCLVRNAIGRSNNEEIGDELKAYLLSHGDVTPVLDLLKADFSQLESDLRKLMAARRKSLNLGETKFPASDASSVLGSGKNMIDVMENGTGTDRMQLVLAPIMGAHVIVNEAVNPELRAPIWKERETVGLLCLEPLLNLLFSQTATHAIIIALAEMPSLFDLIKLNETLLHIVMGPDVIVDIVCNFPDHFFKVIDGLVANSNEDSGEPTIIQEQRWRAISQLLQLFPAHTIPFLSSMIKREKMGSLVISMICDSLDSATSLDEIRPMFNLLLTALNRRNSVNLSALESHTWLTQYIHAANKKQNQGQIINGLIHTLLHLIQKTVIVAGSSTAASGGGRLSPKKEPSSVAMAETSAATESSTSSGNNDGSGSPSKHRSSASASAYEELAYVPERNWSMAKDLLRLVVIMKAHCNIRFAREDLPIIYNLLFGEIRMDSGSSTTAGTTSHKMKRNSKDDNKSVEVKKEPMSIDGQQQQQQQRQDLEEIAVRQVAAVLATPGLLISIPVPEPRFVHWIQSLIDKENVISKNGQIASEFGELILLSALQFHTNQLNIVPLLVSNVLGFKVSVGSSHYSRLKTLMTSADCLSEPRVTNMLARLSVTANLNADIRAPLLPIHSILALLKARTFSKHQIQIKDWIYKQMLECTAPLHPAIVEVIDTYVSSCLKPLTKNSEVGNPPMNLQWFQTTFTGVLPTENDIIPQCLMFYYLLAYRQMYNANVHEFSKKHGTVKNIYTGPGGGSEVWSRIPIKLLFTYVDLHPGLFTTLHSPFLKYAVNQFPYIVNLHHRVASAERNDEDRWAAGPYLPSKNARPTFSPEDMRRGFELCQSKQDVTLTMLRRINPYSLHLSVFEFLNGLQHIMQENTPKQIVVEYEKLWSHLEGIIPRKLYEGTCSVLLDRMIKLDELIEDPFLMFAAPPAVFKSEIVLEMVMRMVEFCMSASAATIREAIVTAAPGVDPETHANSEAEAAALLQAQESAYIHLLLEISLTGSRQIRTLVARHIHRVFIVNPIIIKLVHFQGYSLSLINMMVRAVPSIHICLDFIPELLNQSLSQRVFAVHLLAALCTEFAIPKSLSCAKLAVDVVNTLFSGLPSQKAVSFAQLITEPLANIADVFPTLKPDISSLFSQIQTVGLIHSRRQSTPFGCGGKAIHNNSIIFSSKHTSNNAIIIRHSGSSAADDFAPSKLLFGKKSLRKRKYDDHRI